MPPRARGAWGVLKLPSPLPVQVATWALEQRALRGMATKQVCAHAFGVSVWVSRRRLAQGAPAAHPPRLPATRCLQTITVRDALNSALDEEMERDDKVRTRWRDDFLFLNVLPVFVWEGMIIGMWVARNGRPSCCMASRGHAWLVQLAVQMMRREKYMAACFKV